MNNDEKKTTNEININNINNNTGSFYYNDKI